MALNPGDRPNIMTAGRGRGLRPRISDDFTTAIETHLRLPKSAPKSPSERLESNLLNDIITDIKQLDCNKPNTAELEKINEKVCHAIKTDAMLKELVTKVHKQSTQNPWFGKNAVQFFTHLSSFEVNGTKLRNIVLNSLKEEFEARESVRDENVETFLNGLEFLGNVFHSLRLANGQPIKPLASALVKYLETLVAYPIGRSEARTLFKQMLTNGKELEEFDSDGVEKLLIAVRKCIIEEDLHTSVKYKLLAIVDLAVGQWRLPKQATIDFYNEKDVEFDL